MSESIWKKELSFGRKKKAEPTVPAPVEAAPVVADAAPAEPKQPFWKKEIGGRKKAAPARAPEAAPSAPGEEKVPFWKREVSLGKKKAAATPAPAPEPVVVPPPAVEPDPWVAPETLPPEPMPPAAELAPEPAPDFAFVTEPVEPVALEPVEPVVEAAPEPVPAAELAPAPEPVVPAPAAEVVQDPIPVAPIPVAPAPAPLAPAAVAAPVVHPPVPAAELPPLPDEAKKVPFYKRELGKKKSAQPKALKERKPSRAERKALTAAQTDEPKAKRAKAPRKQLRAPSLPRAQKSSKNAKVKNLVGLKIGASQVAAARVANNGVAEVEQVARMPLAEGIVVGGELRDPDALAETLKEFFRVNKLPRRGVRLGIANNRIGVRTFEIAGIDDSKQLANAIRFRAQEALPIPIDEAVLDYQVLSEGLDDDGQLSRKILLVVAYRELIDRYVAACKKAGIQLVGIDLEAFALLRALSTPGDDSGSADSALVAVSVGHERSTFAVSDGRVCEFTRVLEWGGSALSVAIARALDAAPSEVEAIKHGLSLADNAPVEGLTPEQSDKAREAIRRQVQSFARELVSSLQFYQNQPGSLGIGEIVVTGGTAHLPGLAEELQRLIGVRVRVGDPLAHVKVSKRVREPEQVGSLAVAIGLGIEA